MGGILVLLEGAKSGLSYSGNVTVGHSSISAKGVTADQWGYGTAAVAVGGIAFGSISPGTTNGFTIIGMNWETDTPSGNTYTTLKLTGDSSAQRAILFVNGTNQNLGAGVFSGGVTTYSSGNSQANAFGTTLAAVIPCSM